MPDMSSVIVRDADFDDIPRVIDCVHKLLRELSDDPNYALDRDGAENVCNRILLGREAGEVLVANVEGTPGELIGCLTVSYVDAVRYGGTFATLEEFWVHPDYRSTGVGALLLAALTERFSGYIEVGLPNEAFKDFARTLNFYETQGFRPIGPRLRLPPPA
jgi:GNAT superfamily N-acetyltransferase